METHERLDRHAGSLAALEGAFALLVQHLSSTGALSRPAFMADLTRLSNLPDKDGAVRLAEQRLLRTLEVLR
ncbi:hypothetical protein [Pseudomonas sp. BN515]|uniref:hypothetical protein n=1 Tax=Pseudomonas sp. BN515 TaxID=2567892 RepID=UPI0024545F43|nr:hypothetical protein [Pseudomonas sp. BN515]MDH4869838.1 hypothetical protein [Pseudomonas sp. BN515]